MAVTQQSNEQDPMSAMNMTPLIDVLLVLLIMFIITIPIATHSVEMNIGGDDVVIPAPDPIKNKIVITNRDALRWNGKEVNMKELAALLDATTQMTPEPELQYEPEAQASYDRSVKVLNLVKQSGVTKFGFVGNEKYREFNLGE
ncbi:biopolymer transporter ExbD [Erythrobacter sp. YT30]|uniref:ExbD/TolR family protein n=1 Tax=Erythrobacter sp. YT30 TaxID=1735012 RepID=UPI00076C5FA2|nr:biopolymer transporter ExbD [Erythrobacter sp. YT30]KWV91267.1 biopolymer transporter ExbD [Erythrobacter sp. YT30]